MKILARLKEADLENYSFPINDLSILLIGKNVINNPKAMRYTNFENGDIIFYEED